MRVLIVGGVAAGMSCAARLRRLNEFAEIIVFERSGYVSYANCGLPYHIGGDIVERDKLLVMTAERLRQLLNIDVRTCHEVSHIDRNNNQITVKNLENGAYYKESYDKLVLCPGAHPVMPDIAGIDLPAVYTLRNIEDMDAIKAVVDNDSMKTAVVVGGGYIGVEMAESLKVKDKHVILVGRRNQILPHFDPEMSGILEEHMKKKGIELCLGSAATGFYDYFGKVAVQRDNASQIEGDFVILAAGVKPDSSLAQHAGLDCSPQGGIRVNSRMVTSDSNIYAAGDVVEVVDGITGRCTQVPLAGPANRQGRVVADNICNKDSKYHVSYGSAIVKVFDFAGASIGSNERTLKEQNIYYAKAYVCPDSHAGYYPGADTLYIKLLFSKVDGIILGAQVIGKSGVDKRLDVIATAIKAKMTVYDLEDLELAYAPPYGAAKDAINMVGFVASNYLRGDVDLWYPEDYSGIAENSLIIDLRSHSAFVEAHIPGAVNIPIEELRDRLLDIPRDKNIYLYCYVGYTSYLAYRVLYQHGYGEHMVLKSLSGGISIFRYLNRADGVS